MMCENEFWRFQGRRTWAKNLVNKNQSQCVYFSCVFIFRPRKGKVHAKPMMSNETNVRLKYTLNTCIFRRRFVLFAFWPWLRFMFLTLTSTQRLRCRGQSSERGEKEWCEGSEGTSSKGCSHQSCCWVQSDALPKLCETVWEREVLPQTRTG